MTLAPAPWDMAEWPVRAEAWKSCPTDPAHRAAGAAAAAAMASALADHGPADLSPLPPTLRETWHLEEPLLALEVKLVSAATPRRLALWLESRGFGGVDDRAGAQLQQLWSDHVHRWVLPELADWLLATPGPVEGGDLLVAVAARTWPLLDADSAAAVLRAAVAVDAEAGRAVAAEVLQAPAAAWRVRRTALDLLMDADGEPLLPQGVGVLVAPQKGVPCALGEPDAVRSWLAQLAHDAPGGVRLGLGADGGYALAADVAAGRVGAVTLTWPGGGCTGELRRGQHGLGCWLPGTRLSTEPGERHVPVGWAARACALAGPMLRARVALAATGGSDRVSEQLYRAEPNEWSDFTLPRVLWLPWTTPPEVTDPLLELAGVRLERLDDGSVLTVTM